MYSPKYKRLKKISTWVIIFFFIFQLLSPSFFFTEPAVAYMDTETGEISIIGTITGFETAKTTKETADEVKDTVLDRIFKGLMLSATMVLRNALVYLSQKFAEQTVNWMATGDWGQGAMFYEQAWNKFTDDLMNQTVGVFLDNLTGEIWAETGFDICDPALPEVKIQIMLGLELPNLEDPGMLEYPPVDCTLTKFVNNWEAFGDNIQSKYQQFVDEPGAMSLAYLQDAATLSFEPKYADIGKFLTLENELQAEQQEVKEDEEKQRDEGDGQKAKTSMAGEHVQSPAFAGKKQTEKEIEDVKDMQKSEMESSKEVLTEIPESMVAAFLSSFVSKAFSELIMKKLFEQGVTKTAESYQPRQYTYEPGKQLDKEIKQVTKVQNVSFSQSSTAIDLLTQFTNCPQDRQLYNCVIDQDFAQVVRAATQDKALSLKEAIESGKINGDLPIIPQSDGRNSSRNCYQEGWCYSNLVKLRTARIIPIGWEVAATKIQEGQTVTLNDVMNKFDTPGDFYHLIDPNWILQYPATQCEAMVVGPSLSGSGASERADVCSDLQSCLQTDDAGKCKAYGYCAAEKNVFRFGGESCDGQYDSCRVLTDRDGDDVRYLLNTVDKTGCDPNSVGCKWYSLAMGGDPNWQWQEDADKIFLNKKVEDFECDPKAEGCTRFIRTTAGLGTNLVANGDFEIFEDELNDVIDNNNLVPGWAKDIQQTQKNLDVVVGNSGAAGLYVSGEIFSQPIVIVPKPYIRYFAVSLDARKKGVNSNVDIQLVDVFENLNLVDTLTVDEVEGGVQDLTGIDVDAWSKVYEIWEVTPGADVEYGGGDQHLKIVAEGGAIEIDNVLFEEIEAPSIGNIHQFTEYASKNADYVKQAPEYLKCYNVDIPVGAVTTYSAYGRPFSEADVKSDDDAQKTATIKGCEGFAGLCTAAEVGCEAYSRTDGDRVVNGVVSFNDYCPQQCNGYATFSQSSTYFDYDLFPVYLIPSTAKQCTAAAVGCEEFTNLDELAQGAEAKEYFSELRLCEQLPENAGNCANFYTWVAEEEAGFQLKTYNLKDADKDGVPDTIGPANTVACNKEIFDAKLNPDCREFYNDAGVPSYRLYSQTITCSTDCHPYRRSLQYQDNDLLTAQQQCQNRQGSWMNGECIFYAIPTEGKKCSAAAAGCKEYRGNYSGDEKNVVDAQFVEGDQIMFGGGSSFIVSLPEGQVLSTSGFQLNTDYTAFAPGQYTLSYWMKSETPGNYTVSTKIGPLGKPFQSYNVNSSSLSEWQYFTYSFSVSEEDSYGNYLVSLSTTPLPDKSVPKIYIDSLQIKQVTDVNYLIKDSWNTPATCDQDLLTDQPLPQAQVGCREYKDRVGTTHYLKTFSGLCSAEKVGCEALIDTRNNNNPFYKEYKEVVSNEFLCEQAPTYVVGVQALFALFGLLPTDVPTGKVKIENNQCIVELKNVNTNAKSDSDPVGLQQVCETYNDVEFFQASGQEYEWDAEKNTCYITTATVPADNVIYLVNNEKSKCKNSEKGCTALGLPSFEGGVLSADGWETYFYRIDPDLFGTFNSPVCTSTSYACEEYKGDKGETYFFKNPQGRVCEWKEGTIGTETKKAWFIKGKEAVQANLCGDLGYAVDYYEDGIDHLRTSDDPSYLGWVGECPETQDKCTAFVDPEDDLDNDGIGRAYYYINNELIDRKCTGVNQKEGCILFDNTANEKLTYDAGASYAQATGNNLVAPVVAVNPENADSNEIIKVNRARECAAWYDCKSSHWAWDPNQNRYVEVCDKVGVCSAFTTATSEPKCAKFLNSEQPDQNLITVNSPITTNYQNRDVNWASLEYSGLAVPYMAPLHFYNAFDISQDEKKTDYRLVNFDTYKTVDSCVTDAGCAEFCQVDVNDPNYQEKCRCLNGLCVRPSAGLVSEFGMSSSPACRAYPQKDAPFPYSTRNSQPFANANKMYFGNKVGNSVVPLVAGIEASEDYACSYSEFSYGGGAVKKYYPSEFIGSTGQIQGFCQEDSDIKCSCSELESDPQNGVVVVKTKTTCSSEACGADGGLGTCLIKSEKDSEVKNYQGWQGYCLERDSSLTINNNPSENPCLSWYPTDTLGGLQDIKNNYEEAGYNPPLNLGSLFTTNAAGWNKTWNFDGQPNTVAGNPPYIRHILSLAKDTPGSVMWMIAGDDGYESYIEGYAWTEGYTPQNIYKHDLVGIMVECFGGHSDWCAPGRRYSDQDGNDGFYQISKQAPMSRAENMPNYFYIPIGLPFTNGYGDQNKAMVAHRILGNDGYEFHGFDEQQVANMNQYEYYQLTWDEGAHTVGKPNNWVFGGGNDDGTYKVLIKDSESNEFGGKSPLFMGVGWNHQTKTCVNVITGRALDANICSGSGVPSSVFDKEAYKSSPAWQNDPQKDNWIEVSCSNDNDCKNEAKVGAGNVGAWTAAGVWKNDEFGKCINIGGSNVCSNVKCVSQDSDEQNQSCKNSNGNPVWTCESDVPEAGNPGVCTNALAGGGVVGAAQNFSGFISGYCDAAADNDAGGRRNNYWGLRVMFDEKGKFAGVWQSICDESNGTGYQWLKLHFVFKEYAQELVQVNKQESGNQNMAYTNKIYEAARNNALIKTTSGTGQIKWSSIQSPMGSASLSALSSLGDTINIPYALPGGDGDAAVLQPGGSPWLSSDQPINGGKPYGCDGTAETQYCNGDKDEFDENQNIGITLSNYFARIYQRWTWEKAASSYQVRIPAGSFASDKSGSPQGIPIVAAVVPTGQTDAQGNVLFGALPGKITINGRTEGNIEALDGDLEAVIKFYTWTHDDQMPLRKVAVNWGDGSNVVPLEGKFKNHKPRCQREPNEALGICKSEEAYESANNYFAADGGVYGYACNSNDDCSHLPGDSSCTTNSKQIRFGDVYNVELPPFGTISACDEAYFQFNNQYTCEGKGSVAGICGGAASTNCWDPNYKDGQGACRYRIGVQVQDNWLRCNGDTTWNGEDANMDNGTFNDGCDPQVVVGAKYEYYDGDIYVVPAQ